MSDDKYADNVALESTNRSREHHNAVERKRRDLIKNSFTSLKDSIPSLRDEKPVSRAKILRTVAEFIQQIKNKMKATNKILIISVSRMIC